MIVRIIGLIEDLDLRDVIQPIQFQIDVTIIIFHGGRRRSEIICLHISVYGQACFMSGSAFSADFDPIDLWIFRGLGLNGAECTAGSQNACHEQHAPFTDVR